MCVLCAESLWLFVFDSETPWAIGPQAPLSMGFSRQEYWSGLSCPPPEILMTQEMNPCFLCLPH